MVGNSWRTRDDGCVRTGGCAAGSVAHAAPFGSGVQSVSRYAPSSAVINVYLYYVNFKGIKSRVLEASLGVKLL